MEIRELQAELQNVIAARRTGRGFGHASDGHFADATGLRNLRNLIQQRSL
jgi:hypothetical protein